MQYPFGKFRLLLLVEKIASFTKVNDKKMLNVFTIGIGHVVRGNFGIGPWRPVISFPKKHIKVQFATFVMFISLGIFRLRTHVQQKSRPHPEVNQTRVVSLIKTHHDLIIVLSKNYLMWRSIEGKK